MSQMGTPRPQGGRGTVGHGPGVCPSPPLLPKSWGSWVLSPEVTCKLAPRLKTLGTAGPRGQCVELAQVGWAGSGFSGPLPQPLAPRPALRSLQRHPRAAPRPAVYPACPASVRHTGPARGQGQCGGPWARPPPPSSPVPAGSRPCDLRPLDFILSAIRVGFLP
uniref:Uncharacterized protein n=1 Tax=Rousettus aegyptiacus TaxID=9407 RepID=A0A7J8E7Z4_ROUAE|nr:hypothetical protein HJG63_008099 [Rousettus aegyptiacus]